VICFLYFSLLEIPTRGFRAKVYLCTDDDGSDDGRSEHETPTEVLTDVNECCVHDVSEHDSEGSPHLPHHDEGATDGSGGTFGRVDWDSGGFGTDSETEDETGNE
jgi:hypothetical protein